MLGLEECTSPTLLAGRAHSGALCSSSGQAWLWGSGAAGHLGTGSTRQVDRPRLLECGGQRLCQVALGHQHTLLLDADGAVWALGENKEVQVMLRARSLAGCSVCLVCRASVELASPLRILQSRGDRSGTRAWRSLRQVPINCDVACSA